MSNIYSTFNNWILSPSWILFSYIFLNLNINFPLPIRLLFVSLYSSYFWYNFSSTSAKVSVFKHLIAQLIFWSVELKWITIISSKLTGAFLLFWICNFKLLISISLFLIISFKLLILIFCWLLFLKLDIIFLCFN